MGSGMGEEMRYISLFSGVEACSVAWHHMKNWKPQVFAEFDDFPSAVLAHQFPDVPNVGDVTKHEWKQYRGKCELVVGGSPCQSFSVAGSRLGLDDPRGNLALHFLRVVDDIKPTWFIFENVPGLLSSDNGRDFATFLAEVENIGYGCAYRVLDAQYFGVPQRRRRLFVVGHSDGDWRRSAAVLFEPESLRRDNQTCRAKRKKAATNPRSSPLSGSEEDIRRGITQHLNSKPAGSLTVEIYHHGSIGNQTADTHGTLIPDTICFDHTFGQNAVVYKDVSPTLKANGLVPTSPAVTQMPFHQAKNPSSIDDDTRWEATKVSGTLNTWVGHNETKIQTAVVEPIPIHDQATRWSGKRDDKDDGKGNGLGIGNPGDPSNTLTKNDRHAVFSELVVRRLTPIECERLQGFPDNWTQIPFKGKTKENCPDGHRFKAMGNSMAVPVMRWIGEGVELVNRIPRTEVPEVKELGWL